MLCGPLTRLTVGLGGPAEPLSDTLTMMIGEMKKVLNVSVFPDLGFDDAEDRLRHLSQLLGQKIARTFLAEFAC